MNETLKAIVRILDEGAPELKVAAAQVLGELRPQQLKVTQALESHLGYGDNILNRYILQALSRIGTDAALLVLLSRLRDGGQTDLVRHLLSQGGHRVCKILARSYVGAKSELQEQILLILGQYAEPEAMEVMRSALLAGEERLSDLAVGLLKLRIQEISEARRKTFRQNLHKAVATKPEDLPPYALANALTGLGHVDGAGSRALLLKFTAARHPPLVRRAALLALEGVRLTPNQAGGLLEYVSEPDLVQVAQPAAAALGDHRSWGPAAIEVLRGLLSSRREEIKLFALRALQETATGEVAKLYMTYLHSKNPDFREAARIGLSHNEKAVLMLIKSLMVERLPEKARTLAAPMSRLGEHVGKAQLKSLCEKAGRLLAQAEPLGEVHLELVLNLDSEWASAQLVDKAVRLRRAWKLPEALNILMHMANADRLDPEGRYQMALARLIRDNEEGHSGMTSHTGDATMGYIAGLVRDKFPVFERLKKESMLKPEDLLRVGRHFNESIGPERRFGTDLLRYVADKHAKQRAGEEARMMIRAAGL